MSLMFLHLQKLPVKLEKNSLNVSKYYTWFYLLLSLEVFRVLL